jgi:SH3-like domain-containing protein
MVTCCAARALASRSVLFASLVATFAASAVSQSSGVPTPGVPTPGVTAPAKPVPAKPDVAAVTAEPKAPAAQKAAPVFGKVVGEEVAVRCWASAVATPPKYEDVLKKGQVVQLGSSENGFRAVVLPLGPIGYVSERFTKQAEDGTATSKGVKVAFRYRPRTSEAPVAQMPEGTVLRVLSTEDGWCRVRVASMEAWVAEADVEVVASDPAVLAAHAEFAKLAEAEVQARLDKIAAEQKQKEQDRVDMEAVKLVEAAFIKEMAKPVEEQSYHALKGALGKVTADLAEGGAAIAACAALKKRMETQQWIVDATATSREKPPVTEVVVKEPAKDRLQRFESIGWLRYESRLAGPGVYYIEKGGRRQHMLTCNTGRFDLSLYVGREVGVIGPRRNPIAETLSVLDVERVEVLGSARR